MYMRRRGFIFAGVGLIGAIASNDQSKRAISNFFQLPSEPDLNKSLATNATQVVNSFDYLKQLPAPSFKQGHTLPPLTRFGWTLPFETRVELADRWGYALEWGGYATPKTVAKAISSPQSVQAKIMALAASDPKKYQLAVILNRALPNTPEAIWLHNNQGELVTAKNGKKIWSPEAPVVALEAAAKMRAEPLQQISKIAPIAVVLNGGEYGLGVAGHISSFCEQDPRVVAAKGNRSWFDYISDRKTYQESFITKSVRKIVPNRSIYVYYPTDSNPHRNRSSGWKQWCYDYKYMRSVSDYPNSSTYFKEFNTGWTGNTDILTQVLNSVGQQIQFGDPLSYNWVCSGWIRGKKPVFGEIERYIGFLKCYYTAGMIGGIAGYFDYPNQGFAALFDVNQPPNWLEQIIALARVHALFSHLEEYLRHGNLLPGPMKHIWSSDTPAYEFPTQDPNIRVLVRQHRQKNHWLITAWAASGNTKQVNVTIPQLGQISVIARPNGSVYTANIAVNKAILTWVDQ
ncbi:MAG: hypothetical protein ACKO8W_03960 [Dolichospermum sp.]